MPRGEWRVLDDLGRLAVKQGDTTEAVTRYQDAFKVAQRAGLRAGQVSALEHTAAAYRSAKDYEKATEYYQQALKAAKEAKLREYEWLVLERPWLACMARWVTPRGRWRITNKRSRSSVNWATRKPKSSYATRMARLEKPPGSKDSKPPRKR